MEANFDQNQKTKKGKKTTIVDAKSIINYIHSHSVGTQLEVFDRVCCGIFSAKNEQKFD